MRVVSELPLAFTRALAESCGLGRSRLDGLIRRGEVVPVGPGVHAEAVRWFLASWEERHLALARVAALRFGDAALSHVTAALLWGLPAPRRVPERPHLTVEKGLHPSDDSSWCRVLRCRLPEDQVAVHEGIRTTSPARTAVDCLRSLPLPDALAVADAVVARGTPPGDLVAVRRAQARWPGVARVGLALGLVDGRRESWLESASVGVLHGWLPLPTPQVDVYDLGEHLGRADLLWQGLRVVGEADGRGKFRGDFGGGSSERDVAERLIRADVRARRFREAGLGIVRWGTEDLRRPSVLAARIRSAAPVGPVRAELRCAACREDVRDCRCAPGLRLPDG